MLAIHIAAAFSSRDCLGLAFFPEMSLGWCRTVEMVDFLLAGSLVEALRRGPDWVEDELSPDEVLRIGEVFSMLPI